MNLQEFVDKYLGEKVDFDGYYGGQCVDLYRQYVNEVLDFPQSPGVGGAAEIWDSADPNFYDFIKNTPEGIPEPGDIMIWDRRVGGGFGHVSIFLEGNEFWFKSFDQNWPTLSKCTITTHDYPKSLIGWMHPKKTVEKTVTQEEFDKVRVERDKNWNEREDYRIKLEKLEIQYNRLEDDTINDKKEFARRIKEEEKRYTDLIEWLNKELLTHSEPEIKAAITGLVADEDQTTKEREKIDKLQRELEKLQRIDAEFMKGANDLIIPPVKTKIAVLGHLERLIAWEKILNTTDKPLFYRKLELKDKIWELICRRK